MAAEPGWIAAAIAAVSTVGVAYFSNRASLIDKLTARINTLEDARDKMVSQFEDELHEVKKQVREEITGIRASYEMRISDHAARIAGLEEEVKQERAEKRYLEARLIEKSAECQQKDRYIQELQIKYGVIGSMEERRSIGPVDLSKLGEEGAA